jgi:hypothetical protein
MGGTTFLHYNRVCSEFGIQIKTKRVAMPALEQLYGDKAAGVAFRAAHRVSGLATKKLK